MANSKQNRKESVSSQPVDHFFSLRQRRDQEHNQTSSIRVEMKYTNHTNKSQSRTGSHVSHEQETQNLKLEIDRLYKKLHRMVHVSGHRMPP